ncbi:Adaptive-response sensory-kinase SasA [Brevundimonas sp. NIBR10]|uniref:HAMP domain-containing sensor histidine kinase n=1 Tax=Brevundimonas sp. NIBR10 TaxID=3015997 RepID=UPI0022F1AA5F|nr:ATP-binding protein [Brevundimonas sp. NIBR10]WGM45477.1 Adaptive-response sensory-kinase SasA [Brevundimonas sp. NIBR10]
MALWQGFRDWLGQRTSTQLASALAVMAAVALTGSLFATGHAVRTDQRQQAALAASADYAAMVSKLGAESSLTASSLTAGDAAYLSAWLSVFQSGPERDGATLEQTCRTGRGGAGVRFIRAPVGKPAGLAALETAPTARMPGLGPDTYRVTLHRGVLCPGRAVEVVMVRRSVGSLDIAVGRVVDRSGQAWGWAVLAVLITGAVILISGLTAATYARRRLTHAITEVSQALDRAAVGDFSRRAPEVGVAPELTELTVQANRTLDRLEELLSWLRDSADQLAHDFRTPLARATARLERLSEAGDTAERSRLGLEAAQDLRALTRAMNEAMALREGEAWRFETVALDRMLASVADLYEPLAEEQGVRLVVEAEAVSVLGVSSLLQRAVANLVDNAIKYSPPGGTVTLRAFHDGERPALSVADQGPGIDPERLADAALRSAAADAEGRESHGLGLTFVRAILRRHGAEMMIDDAAPGAIVTAHFTR